MGELAGCLLCYGYTDFLEGYCNRTLVILHGGELCLRMKREMCMIIYVLLNSAAFQLSEAG